MYINSFALVALVLLSIDNERAVDDVVLRHRQQHVHCYEHDKLAPSRR